MPESTTPLDHQLDEHLEAVSQAFARKATVYDAFGEGHENLARMRRRLYDHIQALVPPGARLLELNAGTGLDAVRMVERGYRVHATDLSPGMVAQIQAKIRDHGLEGRLSAEQLSFTQLDRLDLAAHGPFQGIYSNAGGLNCIQDLTLVTRQLPRLLVPGGVVTWVIMPRICPWELLHLLQDPRTATRRLRPGGVMAQVEGVRFHTRYFSAGQVRRAFGPRFRQAKLEALSLLTPTADNKAFAARHPRLFRWLVAWDERLSRWPLLRGWGDFFILSMEFLG